MRFKGAFEAKEVERHGIKFDSVTEADFYSTLLSVGIPFEYQVEVILQDPVKINKKIPLLSAAGIHQIKVTVDFIFTRAGIKYYIDTKGSKKFASQRSKMAYQILKARLYYQQEYQSVIKFLDRNEINTLSKLSKLPDKSHFWARFTTIKSL